MADDQSGSSERALIADDDEFFRIALKSILSDRLGIGEVIESGSLDEALEVLGNSDHLDIALFDLAMPGMESSASLGAVRTLFPDTRVVVVSSSRRRDDILTALGTGVHGYIPKGYRVEELTRAIRMIMGGEIYVPPSLAEVSSDVAEPVRTEGANPLSVRGVTLTTRQWDVLRLIVEGRSNKEIARALNLGEGTVKIHLAAVFRNLGVRNRSAAAVSGAALLSERGTAGHRAG